MSSSRAWQPWLPLPYANLTELQAADPDGGQAFELNQYVRLGDGSRATWDGASWSAWSEPVVVQMQSMSATDDPSAYTVAQVRFAVENDPDSCGIAPAVLAAEQAGQNRSTLVNWLEGFIDSCEDVDESETD